MKSTYWSYKNVIYRADKEAHARLTSVMHLSNKKGIVRMLAKLTKEFAF